MSITIPVTGRMLIGGELVESLDGGWLTATNPADESKLGKVPDGTARDMGRAVAAAVQAHPAWAALPMAKRADYINQLADAISARAEDIAVIETMDTGNTIGSMRGDVSRAATKMRLAAGLGYEIKGDTIPATPGNLHLTLRVPYGVVGRIVAFNHPFAFAASRIAPSIIAGNAVVLKPPEQSPLSSSILAELCATHLPPGVVNIVTGGPMTGDALVRDPRVKRIAFIGSGESGMAIQRAAAETSVKAVSLELGGKNPLIAFSDADPDRVAAASVSGMNFSTQGQSCGSTSRVLLHDDIYDAVIELIIDRVSAIKVGDPLDLATEMGPINNQAQYDKVMSYIALGREEGAKLHCGGARPTEAAFDKGYWVTPAVFGDVTRSMRIATEEIFGPVLSVMRFRDEDEAIDIANGIDLGLTGAVWTHDLSRAMRVAQALEAGYVWVNGVGTHYRGAPFGGFKNSGVGREEGISEILSYTEEKTLNLLT